MLQIDMTKEKSLFKKAFFVLIVFFIICQYSCDSYPNQPEKVVNNYYKALVSGDFSEAAKYLLDKDRTFANTIDDEASKMMLKEFWRFSKWDFVHTNISGDKAVIKVHFNVPNLGELFGASIASRLSATDISGTEIDFQKNVLNKLKTGQFEYMEMDQNIDLTLDQNRWKISLDLEKRKKVSQMILDSARLVENKKYADAEDILNQALILDENNSAVKYFLEKIKQKKQKSK